MEKNLKVSPLFQKYGLYILLALYVIIIVHVLRSKWLYRYDDKKQKKVFVWKRSFILCIVFYACLVAILVLWNRYLSVAP